MKNKNDFPMIVGKIEIIKSNLDNKKLAHKALKFQLHALEKDMTVEINKYFNHD